MKDFILTENSTIFYFDNKMNGKGEDDPGVMYVWLDSGYVTKTGGHPIFISLLKIDDYFSGHFVGNAKVLSGTIIDYYPQNARSITANLSRFPLKYEKKINKRMPDFTEGFVEYIEYGFDIRDFYDELHRWAIHQSEKIKHYPFDMIKDSEIGITECPSFALKPDRLNRLLEELSVLGC